MAARNIFDPNARLASAESDNPNAALLRLCLPDCARKCIARHRGAAGRCVLSVEVRN
jgi:hypothetical protein